MVWIVQLVWLLQLVRLVQLVWLVRLVWLVQPVWLVQLVHAQNFMLVRTNLCVYAKGRASQQPDVKRFRTSLICYATGALDGQ